MDCAFSEGSVTTLKNLSQNTLNYFCYPGPQLELVSRHKDSVLRMQFPFFLAAWLLLAEVFEVFACPWLSRGARPALTTWWQCWIIFRNTENPPEIVARELSGRMIIVLSCLQSDLEGVSWLPPEIFVGKSFSILTRIFLARRRNGILQVFEDLGGWVCECTCCHIALGWHWIHVSVIPGPICIIISNVKATWCNSFFLKRVPGAQWLHWSISKENKNGWSPLCADFIWLHHGLYI